jgi:hypothetical protein
MDDRHAEKRLERIEDILEAITKQIDVLARATEQGFRDLHHSINYRFERVSERLEVLEGKLESFSR